MPQIAYQRSGLRRRPAILALSMFLLFIVAGCSEGGGMLSSAPPDWEMSLTIAGQDVQIPLDVMNVYVFDDPAYPEIYEILGQNVALAGEFPIDVRVDYGENWKVLFGMPIEILESGGDPRDPVNSFLTLPGQEPMPVVGGAFVAEKLTGKYAGRDGDLTLSGKIILVVDGPEGEMTLEGTFAVHCVSWG